MILCGTCSSQKEGKRIRLALKDHFKSEERLQLMSYEEKRKLLHWLFDGNDDDGKPYGIYLRKLKGEKWEFMISAQLIHGTRRFKGDHLYWFKDHDSSEDKNIEKGIKRKKLNFEETDYQTDSVGLYKPQ